MEPIIKFWASKSSAEKRKYIVYGIAGAVSILLIVIVVLLTSKDDTKEVADFSNPDAKEVKKFNSRAEANQLGKTDSASLDLAMNNVFGKEEEVVKPAEVEEYTAPTYSNNNSNSYSQPSYSNNSSSNGGGGSGYNSHSTYGDYSMWQSDEPKNNSVGYTNKKGVPAKKVKQTESYEEITPQSNYTQPSYNQPTYNNSSNVDLAQQQQVSAQLISQGTFQDGRTLSFALKEATTIKGNKLPKNFVIQGIGQFQNNRIMVRFNAIKVNNKLVPVNITLMDGNGIEGMGVAGAEKGSSAENQIGNEVISRTGTVGQIVGTVFKGKPSERTVSLKPKQVYLVIN